MYTRFQLVKKYIFYYLSASNGKGHGIHSPFVFDLINNVLRSDKKYNAYDAIEKQRKILYASKAVIEVEDFGAGSAIIPTSKRAVKDIARSSLKPKKYGQLLYRMVRYYQPKTIVELGTSFGITTSYLAAANLNAMVYTCEGAGAIARIAQQTFEAMKLENVVLCEGDFKKTLPQLFSSLLSIDFAFIDGNHQEKPTLQYYQQLLSLAGNSTVFVFDDIHWSAGMESAWWEIKKHPAVTLTIDLFFIGLVYVNPDFKVKQHFTIRF